MPFDNNVKRSEMNDSSAVEYSGIESVEDEYSESKKMIS